MMSTQVWTRRELVGAGLAVGSLGSMGAIPSVARAEPTCDGWFNACGTRLQYRQYGGSNGYPVFYFHGMPGSRLEPGLIADEVRMTGVRLIAINRPGIGGSMRRRQTVWEWPCVMSAAANSLGIDCFSVMGVSGGTPFALACAARLPRRVQRVAIVSGHAPFRLGLPRGNQDVLVRVVGACQGLGGVALALIKRKLRNDPSSAMQSLAESWTDADRRLVFCDPVNRAKFRQNLVEAFCQPHGLADDIQRLAKPWGFEVCQVRCTPVRLWHGGCDELVPPSHAQYMHDEICNSTLVLNPCTSHVTTLKTHAYDVLTFLQTGV